MVRKGTSRKAPTEGQQQAEERSREGKARLVIVESPAKARTVGRFLGKGYQVKASIGHVRDLLRSKLSVDLENDFAPHYRVLNEKRKVVQELAKAAAEADEVYLATDPDREGEAIAWHLMAATHMDRHKVRRVVFHEITKDAVEEAFAHPRDIDMRLVDAQQARRILDRLVGYQISPILWRKVRNRLTAGRVQSVAVRLVVEREREIQSFVPEEYWSIQAELAPPLPPEARPEEERASFLATLHRIRGEPVDLRSGEEVQRIVAELERSLYRVASVRRGTRQRKPSAPFITSTMQQEASRYLGFTARKTMAVAQALYEGVPIGGDGGNVGLITYMRTDSTNVAEVAQQEARRYIGEKFGEAYLPAQPPLYKTRAKRAQEAHEAIRPTSVYREPQSLKPYLTRDQYRLYDLIWRRFVASQMAPAVYDTVSVDVEAGPTLDDCPYLFRAASSTLRFPGFLKVYNLAEEEGEESPRRIPDLSEGELLDLLRLLPEQHFTQPPPRYTEATLIRALEEQGIGRPSTYAPIMSTIQARGYVERVNGRLHPTPIAFLVNDLLVEYFPEVMDVGFTARMEEFLDDIAAGERAWVPVVREFYGPFSQQLERAQREMPHAQVQEETEEVCEKCGHPMVVKYGRYGKFLACSNYPTCRNTKSFVERTGARCPQCGGDLVRRRSRRGRFFYGCSNYPTCNFVVWKRPLKTPCPSCGGLLTEGRKDEAVCTQCQETFPLAQVEPATEGEAIPEPGSE
ncbi:MAG: type I DNA topoisomerase [Anaerolineae bacterium]